jgi:hypothetical protein
MRATVSMPPPAVYGTTMRTARVGQVCAVAGSPSVHAAAIAPAWQNPITVRFNRDICDAPLRFRTRFPHAHCINFGTPSQVTSLRRARHSFTQTTPAGAPKLYLRLTSCKTLIALKVGAERKTCPRD